MLDRHPEWARTCDDCRRYVFGANGAVSTTEQRRPDGRVVELPVLVPPGFRPPCGVCPKLEGVEVKAPLDPADDFGGLFAELRQWWREGRAVGFPPGLGPLPRAAAALFDGHDRRRADRQRANQAGEAVAAVLVAAGLTQRRG